MKRMKKKVVAMVTLAMFVLSMVPMAAFAGTKDSLTAVDTTVTVAEKASVTVETVGANAPTAEVWVEDANTGKIVKNVEFFTKASWAGATVDGVATVERLGDGQTVQVKFGAPGEYVVKANRVVKMPNGKLSYEAFEPTATITVTGTEVNDLTATANVPEANKNGYQLNVVNVTATGANDGAVVDIVNNYEAAGIKVVDANHNAINKVTVDKAAAVFYVTVEPFTPAGEYLIDLACNGKKGVATITVAGKTPVASVPTTIKALPVDGLINQADANSFKKVRVEVLDQFGKPMQASTEAFQGTNSGAFTHDAYVNVVKQPKKTLADSDVVVAYDTDAKNYYLNATGKTDKFVPGDYAIEFVLNNAQKATVNFTVDAFNDKEVKDLVIKPDNGKYEIPVTVDGDGNVAASPAMDVNFKVFEVDNKGIEKEVTAKVAFEPVVKGVTVGVNGKTFTAKYTGKAADIIGTNVTIKAFYANGTVKTAVQEFTFVEKKAPETGLQLYKIGFVDGNGNKLTDGKVLSQNTVVAKLYDDEGSALSSKVTFAINETPLKVSNKDAKVIVKADKSANTNGKFTIYSDKPTTVDVQVLAWYDDTNTNAVYGATLTYTIGADEVVPADKTLVGLTIGSKDMIVNNDVVKIDAAPFVDKNWRTMVPLSAITEAFGVTPEWNEKDRSVTVEMNGVKVVMTIDKQAYTVNGEKKTMDTAPVIVNSRTMVPVRFIAEELGFAVSPVMSDKGLTEGVIITK